MPQVYFSLLQILRFVREKRKRLARLSLRFNNALYLELCSFAMVTFNTLLLKTTAGNWGLKSRLSNSIFAYFLTTCNNFTSLGKQTNTNSMTNAKLNYMPRGKGANWDYSRQTRMFSLLILSHWWFYVNNHNNDQTSISYSL